MLDQLIRQSSQYDSDKQDFGPSTPAMFKFLENRNDGSVGLFPYQELFTQEQRRAGTRFYYKLNDHAFRQVCRRLGAVAWPGSQKTLPTDYLAVCPADIRAEQLNHWREQVPSDRKWFVRTYKDECRAVLTGRYSTVDVTETLEWVQEALDSRQNPGSYEIIGPVVTPDVMYLRISQRNVDTGSGVYAIGAFVMTGETGNRGIAAYPFIQRNSCTNSIYVPLDAWSFNSKHIGNGNILRSLFISSIFRAFEGAVIALDRLLDAENHTIDNFAEHVDALVKERSWTTVTRDKILIGSEGSESLFGLVNGITAASQELASVDARVDMELFAGGLLTR